MQENTNFSNVTRFAEIVKRIPGLDAKYAIEVIGGSAALYEKMMLQFTHLLASYIDDMDSFFGANQWNDFAIKAHGLKGSLRQIGNFQLANAAEALEKAAKSSNTNYCRKHYGDFKGKLLHFFAQVNAAFDRLEEEKGAAQRKTHGDIRDYAAVLTRAKQALEDYDSLLASDILSPLAKIEFGEDVDELLTKAFESLESFQPYKALGYIMDIIGKC